MVLARPPGAVSQAGHGPAARARRNLIASSKACSRW